MGFITPLAKLDSGPRSLTTYYMNPFGPWYMPGSEPVGENP